jgi:hypothetical protein
VTETRCRPGERASQPRRPIPPEYCRAGPISWPSTLTTAPAGSARKATASRTEIVCRSDVSTSAAAMERRRTVIGVVTPALPASTAIR